MQLKKLVSIVVPCYNEEESLPYLYKAVCKIMAELSRYNWELLFINDGSNDKTLDIIKKYAETDTRISYINLSRNFWQRKCDAFRI